MHAKFCRNRSNRGCDMAIFQFLKMAAIRHFGFSKIGNFNFRFHLETQYASPYQISRRSVKPFRRYGRFSIFQDGGRPPSWIFKSWKFQLSVPFGGPICVSMPNFAKIGRTVPEIWPIFNFQYGGRRHLGFWKFQIFNGSDAQECQTASACQILSKSLKPRLRYGEFSIF